jgi:predicted phosphodiesterase
MPHIIAFGHMHPQYQDQESADTVFPGDISAPTNIQNTHGIGLIITSLF